MLLVCHGRRALGLVGFGFLLEICKELCCIAFRNDAAKGGNKFSFAALPGHHLTKDKMKDTLFDSYIHYGIDKCRITQDRLLQRAKLDVLDAASPLRS